MEITQNVTLPVTLLVDGTANISGAFTPIASSFVIPRVEEALELPIGTVPRSFNFQEGFDGLELSLRVAELPPNELRIDSDVITNINGLNSESSIDQVLDILDLEVEPEVIEILNQAGIENVGDGLERVNDLFDINLNGTGTFQSDLNGDGIIDPLTEFTNFTLESVQGESVDEGFLLITDYDPVILENILTSNSQFSFNGAYTIDLNTDELVEVLEELEDLGVVGNGTADETAGFVELGRVLGAVDQEGDLGLLTGTINLTDVNTTVV
ncbi:MAG: hypothetical protein F6K36_23995 [Symploca sp. SIO3C6]|uniref:Uncharacterized protein n=1 Tax=Symploca sp. SIO1C4 TaxID=2607765 RepID=A0A6B3NIW5_9CYAN|nr:hypothetical protein [Symploca sp. SIO3C6]NER31643.1 hypothetical protein [Symploca sp. SIO1C4]